MNWPPGRAGTRPSQATPKRLTPNGPAREVPAPPSARGAEGYPPDSPPISTILVLRSEISHPAVTVVSEIMMRNNFEVTWTGRTIAQERAPPSSLRSQGIATRPSHPTAPRAEGGAGTARAGPAAATSAALPGGVSCATAPRTVKEKPRAAPARGNLASS